MRVEEVGIARAAADQRHSAEDASLGRPIRAMELGGEDAAGLVLRATEDGAAEGTLQQPLPEAAPGAGVGNGLGDGVAQALGAPGEHAEIGRKQRLQKGLDLARQHGGRAFRADRHGDGIAVDDRGRDEGGERGRIDDVDGNAACPGRARHGGIEQAVTGCRVDEPLALEIAGLEGPQQDPQSADLRELGQLVDDAFGDNRNARAGLAQQAHLLRGLLAAADDKHIRLLEIGKEGEIAHGLSGSRRSRVDRVESHRRLVLRAKQAARGGPDRQGGGETGQDSARALPLNRMFFSKTARSSRE